MAISVAGECAEKGIGAQIRTGLFPVPRFILVWEVMPGSLLDVLIYIGELPRLQRSLNETAFEITINAVFLHAVVNNVVAAPLEIPQHVSDSVAVLLANFAQPANAIDQLAAISTGCAPANAVGLNERYRIATLGERQRRGNAGKSGANHADVRRFAAFEQRVIGDFIDRGSVIRACMFLFLINFFHFCSQMPCSDFIYIN